MAETTKVHTLSAEELASGKNFVCVVCSERWLESDVRYQDGIESDRRCPNCFEPNGGFIARNLDRAAASDLAARLTEEHSRPPLWPGWFDETDEVAALLTFTPEPRTLTAGGAAAVLTITGTGLST